MLKWILEVYLYDIISFWRKKCRCIKWEQGPASYDPISLPNHTVWLLVKLFLREERTLFVNQNNLSIYRLVLPYLKDLIPSYTLPIYGLSAIRTHLKNLQDSSLCFSKIIIWSTWDSGGEGKERVGGLGNIVLLSISLTKNFSHPEKPFLDHWVREGKWKLHYFLQKIFLKTIFWMATMPMIRENISGKVAFFWLFS